MDAVQRRRRAGGAADADPPAAVRRWRSRWDGSRRPATSTCSPCCAIRSRAWLLFLLCMLALFHWAHRFRYTLYDGLQIKHLNEMINPLCYGGAIVGSVLAGYLLWLVP